MINYSANGAEITSDISENITQNSYIPAGTTVSILNDVTIEPNVKLTISKTGKLVIPEGKTLTISRGSALVLKHLPYETPDVVIYPVSKWSSEITDPDSDEIYTDSVFTYTKDSDKFVRRFPIYFNKDTSMWGEHWYIKYTDVSKTLVEKYMQLGGTVIVGSLISICLNIYFPSESDNSKYTSSETYSVDLQKTFEGNSSIGYYVQAPDISGEHGWIQQGFIDGTVVKSKDPI